MRPHGKINCLFGPRMPPLESKNLMHMSYFIAIYTKFFSVCENKNSIYAKVQHDVACASNLLMLLLF